MRVPISKPTKASVSPMYLNRYKLDFVLVFVSFLFLCCFTDRVLRALGLRFSMACIETLQTTQMAGAKITYLRA